MVPDGYECDWYYVDTPPSVTVIPVRPTDGRVPTPTPMAVMGWSSAAMATRYQHVLDSIRKDVAGQVGGLLWDDPKPVLAGDEEDAEDGAAGYLSRPG